MNFKILTCLLTSILVASMAFAGPPTCPMSIQTISDVQSSVDAGSPTGASLCNGQAVSLEGIVYAVYGGATPSFAFADAAGPWNGLYVYGPDTVPNVGDEVTVTGTISEFNGLTEIAFPTTVTVDSSGNAPYAPTAVTTAMIATGIGTAESFEGVFVEVTDVEILDDNLGFGEWQIDDGSGATRVDDLGAYCYRAVEGNFVDTLRGMLHYSFDDFKLEPQNDCDFLEFGCSGAATVATIPAIQGSGPTSPSLSEVVETTGVVTGHFEGNYPGFTFFDGFFIQDPAGDGNSATSDGLFVISDTVPTLGNSVTVQGVVGEFGEFDGTGCFDGCVTMVCAVDITDGGAGAAIAPTPWTPPTDTDGEYEYHESLEGMVVSIAGSAKVVGPTSFGALFVVDDSEGVERVLRGTASQGKQVGVRHWELFGDINGGDAPDLIVGSVVQGVEGPLTTSFGDPLVITQAGAPWSTVTSEPLPSPTPSWPTAPSDTFTAATFNVENLDVGDTTKITKAVDIITRMGCPTFLALEEVDTVSTLPGAEDEVLSTLVSSLSIAGCPYDSFNSHPDFGDHGVAILWRTDQTGTVSVHADVQGCSTVGSSSSEAYDDFCDALPGEYPLFSRRPVVLTAEINAACGAGDPIEVTVIANHFKSKLGGAPADQRRLEQGQLVASTVEALQLGGSDHVLVLGDLNDFEDAPPVAAMTDGGPLGNLWTEVAASDRYSYIFSGVSQVLDHQLATPELSNLLLAISPMHFDADFPGFTYGSNASVPWAVSDHDPVVATFDACAEIVLFADGFESGDTMAW